MRIEKCLILFFIKGMFFVVEQVNHFSLRYHTKLIKTLVRMRHVTSLLNFVLKNHARLHLLKKSISFYLFMHVQLIDDFTVVFGQCVLKSYESRHTWNAVQFVVFLLSCTLRIEHFFRLTMYHIICYLTCLAFMLLQNVS